MGRRARPVATYTRAPLLVGRRPATAGGLLARLAAVARTRREAKDHSPLPVRSRPTGARLGSVTTPASPLPPRLGRPGRRRVLAGHRGRRSLAGSTTPAL